MLKYCNIQITNIAFVFTFDVTYTLIQFTTSLFDARKVTKKNRNVLHKNIFQHCLSFTLTNLRTFLYLLPIKFDVPDHFFFKVPTKNPFNTMQV